MTSSAGIDELQVAAQESKSATPAPLTVWTELHGGWVYIYLISPTGEHRTITHDFGSEFLDREAFREWRRKLIVQGRWPHGDLGSETEPDSPAFRLRPVPVRPGGKMASDIIIEERGPW